MTAETGYAAWTFSRVGKINAWSWHGLGPAKKLHAWACLGDKVYARREDETSLNVIVPEQYLPTTGSTTDSTSVEAVTQWLDFGAVGQDKTLMGIDADVKNVTSIEVYISQGGDRTGVLVDTIDIGSNNDGWTYNGELIPLCITATEFKLRFIGDGFGEVQINRVTLHYD